MTDIIIEKKTKDWYKNQMVKYLILPTIRERTVDFITPRKIQEEREIKRPAFRYLRVNSIKGFDFNIDRAGVIEDSRNFYSSVAHVSSEFPILSWDFTKEKQQRKEINDNFESYVVGYDLKFDIDNSDLEKAHEDATKLKNLLDEYKIPYYVIFSGNKGFNFTIDDSFIPESVPVLKRPEIFLKLAQKIAERENIESLDLGVYTIGRVFKVPYSVEMHKGFVALPLSDPQFKDFLEMMDKDMFSIENVVNFVKPLMNRGLLTRHHQVNQPQLIENVQNLFDEFLIEKKVGVFGRIKKAWGES